MAHNNGKKSLPYSIFSNEEMNPRNHNHEFEKHESDSDAQGRPVLNKDQKSGSTREREADDEYDAQFVKHGQEKAEEQGDVTVDEALPAEHKWNRWLCSKGTLNVEDIWDEIDEETAPKPNFANTSQFEAIPINLMASLDPEQLDNAAYLREQLQFASDQLDTCRLRAVKQEQALEQANWDRSRAQLKFARMLSFTRHVMAKGRAVVKSAKNLEKLCLTESKKLAKRKKDFKRDETRLQKRFDEAREYFEGRKGDAQSTRQQLRLLRDSCLSKDAILHALQEDVQREFEEEQQEIRAKHDALQVKEMSEIRKVKRDLINRQDVTDMESRLQMDAAVLKAEFDRGYAVGHDVGRRVDAMSQYQSGYFFGRKHTKNMPQAEFLKIAKQEGIKETVAEYDLIVKEIAEGAAAEVEKKVAARMESEKTKIAHQFAHKSTKHEALVYRNARALGLLEGSLTQIRLQNNVQGAEQEEQKLASRVGKICGEQLVAAVQDTTNSETIWHRLFESSSHLSIQTELVSNSTFVKAVNQAIRAEATKWQPVLVAIEAARQSQRQSSC